MSTARFFCLSGDLYIPVIWETIRFRAAFRGTLNGKIKRKTIGLILKASSMDSLRRFV